MDITFQKALSPSQVSALLDGFIADQQCIPSDASPVTAIEDLPRNLQRVAVRAPANEGWRAWFDKEGRIWFVRGKVSNTFSRRTHRPAMHIFFHDEEGELTDSGVWAKGTEGHWDPCEIPDARAGRRPNEN